MSISLFLVCVLGIVLLLAILYAANALYQLGKQRLPEGREVVPYNRQHTRIVSAAIGLVILGAGNTTIFEMTWWALAFTAVFLVVIVPWVLELRQNFRMQEAHAAARAQYLADHDHPW